MSPRFSKKKKRSLEAPVMLTSLVDAFSILVVFLLINFSNTGDILTMSKDIELPTAAKVSEISRNVIVKVELNKLYVDEKEITPDALVGRLIEIKNGWAKTNPESHFTGEMTIQADRRQTYDLLSQVVQAGSHAGYSDINFAVIRK